MSSVVSFVSLLAVDKIFIKHRPIETICSASADQEFGPAIRGCRSNFDFTLFFEETVLTLLPCVAFLPLALVRIVVLLTESPVAKTGWQYASKIVSLDMD